MPLPITTEPTQLPADASAGSVVSDVTCTFCSCMCDDISVHTQNNRVVAAERACELGRPWFLDPPDEAAECRIDGRPASRNEALERAVQILRAARNPLLYGFRHSSCEALGVGVDIAERLGGNLDTAVSVGHGSSIVAYQEMGKVTCTLGEIRHRGDLVICWGGDPATSHPRLLERSTAPGRFLTARGATRRLVVVDVRPTATSQLADQFLQIEQGRDFEALWVLRALAAGVELDADEVRRQTGVELAAWQELMGRMKQARFGSILFGMGIMQTGARHGNVAALFALTREMNRYTRFVCRSAKGRGNVVGADNVLTWRTGYSFSVNFARGYPRYNPGEYTAEDLLRRNEVDAAVVVGTSPARDFGPAASQRLAALPTVAIGHPCVLEGFTATVELPTSRLGIETPGTVYRMDEVPVQVRTSCTSRLPSDLDVLLSIKSRLGS